MASHPDAHAAAGAHAVHHDPNIGTTGLDNRKVGMWIFLGSDCMFFGSLIGTYLSYKGKSVGGPVPRDVFNIPLTSESAAVLLLSSLTMVLALAALEKNDHKWTGRWLLATALLGAHFVGNQVYEFYTFAVHDGLRLSTNLFGSTFFTLTGFHGAHVTAGVLWLLTLLAIDYRRGLGPKDAINVDLAALYWHFVDVVWIVIFTLVYLIK